MERDHMSSDQRYIFVVQLDQPEQFEAIFGEAIVKFAYADLTRDLQQLSENLLQKYQLFGPIVTEYFGRWFRLFGPKNL